jgi:hypothetical protein
MPDQVRQAIDLAGLDIQSELVGPFGVLFASLRQSMLINWLVKCL